jgi:hypothetical protein
MNPCNRIMWPVVDSLRRARPRAPTDGGVTPPLREILRRGNASKPYHYHVAGIDAENDPRDPVPVEIATHLPQSVAKRRTMRSANWPSEFDLLNILTDRTAIGVGEFQKPLPDRDRSCRIHVKPGRQFFRAIDHCDQCAKIGTYSQASFQGNYGALASSSASRSSSGASAASQGGVWIPKTRDSRARSKRELAGRRALVG